MEVSKVEIKEKTIEKDEDFLRQVSVEVDFLNDDYKSYVEMLKNYCENNAVYAMAPVQIGIPKRMIYLRNTKESMDANFDSSYNENQVLINPVILSKKGRTKFIERCQSCMDYSGVVERPYIVEVGYYDIEQNYKTRIFEGFEATVFCHEFDQLNGVLHIDIAEEIYQMSLEEIREYRRHHPYEIISKN